MALKGFLASGFQKLIGASRIKGANEKFIGEFNESSIGTTAFPLPVTVYPGFNFIRYTGSANLTYTGGNLFSVTPTSEAVVIIQNLGTGGLGTEISIGDGGQVDLSGGEIVIRLGESVTLIYDTVNSLWREITRTSSGVCLIEESVPIIGALTLSTNARDVFAILESPFSGSAAIYELKVGSNPLTVGPTGTRVTLQGKYDLDMTKPVTFIQYLGTPSTSLNQRLLINGDFQLTRNSTLTLVQTGVGWVEVSRSNPTY